MSKQQLFMIFVDNQLIDLLS